MANKEVPIPKYKQIGGKRYRRVLTRRQKRHAEKYAQDLRDIGSSARIIKYGKNYVVYARG